MAKTKEWDYMGKRYRWTKIARHQGYIECTCKRCQRFVKYLVKEGELIEIPIPPTDKSVGILGGSL